VLEQVCVDLLPEGIEDKFNAFATSEFGGGHKVAVACNQNDGIDLFLQRQGRDVQADTDVHAFLP